MCKKRASSVIEITPTDQSPYGIEELAYVINALLFEGLPDEECETEEDLRRVLKEYLARPEQERNRETLEIAARARQYFREMKLKEKNESE